VDSKPSIRLTNNVMKHFAFTKTEDNYTFQVFKHEGYSKKEVKEIQNACKNVMLELVKSLNGIEDEKMYKMYAKNIRLLLITLLLNVKEKSEVEALKEILKYIKPKTTIRIMNNELFDNWESNESIKYIENILLIKVFDVALIHKDEVAPDIELLNKEELKQYRLIAIRSRLGKNLRKRKLNKRSIEQLKTQFDREKHEIIKEAKSLGYTFSNEDAIRVRNTRGFREVYDVIEKIKGMHMVLLYNFFTSKIYNGLDAHYLFNQFEQVDQYYINAIKILGGVITGKEETLPLTTKEIKDNLKKMETELTNWKGHIFVPDKEFIKTRKSINRLKWTQETKNQGLAKIKPKVKGFRSINLKNKVKSIVDKLNKAIYI